MQKIQKFGLSAMLFMLFLTFAHAKETHLHTVAATAATNVCEILGDKEYADLGEALAAVKNNQTIKLLQNINYNKDDGIEIDGKSITFDLNGFNLNVVAKETALYVSNGEVNLKGTGEFNVTSDLIGVRTDRGGKATVTNATSNGKSVTNGIYGARADNNSTVTVLGNVTSEYNSVLVNIAVIATYNSTIKVYGNVTGYDYGTCAYYNSTVTVNCNVTAKGDRIGVAVYTTDNSNVTVHGNVTGSIRGVSADNANVTVHGNVTGSIRGVSTDNANVTVGGDIITTGGSGNVLYGIDARNGSIVKVAGNTYGAGPSGGYGVNAVSGSNVSVGGDAIGTYCGVIAGGNKTTVTVSGFARGYVDFIGSTMERYGIRALDGANVTVTGSAIGTHGVRADGGSKVSVTGGATGSGFGIIASDNNTTVTVSGDVTGSIEGVSAIDNSHVTVSGDVIGNSYGLFVRNATVIVDGSVTGNISGIQTMDGAIIMISGDVTGVDGVRIQMGGNGNMTAQSYYYDKAEVTIDGQIKILNDGAYIRFFTVYPLAYTVFELTHDDNQPTSNKQGYLEYTDGFNYVWVKGEDITGTDNILQPSSSLKAYIQNGRLHVSGLTVGDLWTVYNLSGMIVHQNRATAAEADINLPTKGIYIIVSARQSAKVGNF